MTDVNILRAILTPRQFEMWEIKKNFIKSYHREPKQSEIAFLMRISQPEVSRLQKRISKKLSKC